MTNLEAIDYLYANYDKHLRMFTKKSKSVYVAEECIGKFIEHLLNKPNEIIEHPIAYVYRGIWNQLANFQRTEKKRLVYGEEADTAYNKAVDVQDMACDQLDLVREDYKQQEFLKRSINSLPPKQKLAIENFIKNNHTYGEDGFNDNTQKTNLRCAINKLKNLSVEIPEQVNLVKKVIKVVPTKIVKQKPDRISTKYKIEDLIQSYDELKNKYKVSIKHGISPSTVRRILKRVGVLRTQSLAAKETGKIRGKLNG